MRWFKLFGEARNDAKLRLLSDDQFRTWFNLLCLASEQDDAGELRGYEPFLLAVEVASGDEALLESTIQKLKMLRIIEVSDGNLIFLAFKERQYDKPSQTPERIAERKRLSRERQKNKGEVTTGHTDVTPESHPSHAESHRRGEEKRGEENNTPPPPAREPQIRGLPPDLQPSDESFKALQKITNWLYGVKTPKHDSELIASALALRQKTKPEATPVNIAEFGRIWKENLGRSSPMPGQVVSEWDNVFNPPNRNATNQQNQSRASPKFPTAAERKRDKWEVEYAELTKPVGE